jgi:iron complex transport system substrate-binding protein
MTLNYRNRHWPFALLLISTITILGCDQKSIELENATNQPLIENYEPILVQHNLGETVVEHSPKRVAALDMNEVDFLNQLNIPVIGMPKDFVPHFLIDYKNAPNIQDLGAIVQPNLERVHAAKPDLILITSLQANNYKELSEIAPTIHFDVDYRDSQVKHIEVIKNHLATLGQIFGKENLAAERIAELDRNVEKVKGITLDRSEKALVILHNNGAFSSFGVQSRYGFIFNDLGVKPASLTTETGLHGQPISSEFIQQANPDIIYVVDRSAVMEHRPVMDAESLSNPLLRQTAAWKKGRVIFVDPEAWYITAASPTSLKLIIDDIIKGYQR